MNDGDHSDRISAATGSAGRLFLVALGISLVLLGASLVERERVAVYTERHAQADKVFDNLDPVVRQIETVEQSLISYLITAYGAYPSQAQAARSLLKDRRDAIRLIVALDEALRDLQGIDLKRVAEIRRQGDRYARLLQFNAPRDGQIVTDEAPLPLADPTTGSIRPAEEVDTMTMGDLARLAYLASLRPDLLRGSGTDNGQRGSWLDEVALADIEIRFDALAREIELPVSKQTRRDAAELWKHHADLLRNPGALGVSLEGERSPKVGGVRETYYDLTSFRTPPDLAAWRTETRIDPFGAGFQISLGVAAQIVPPVVAGLLLIAAMSLRNAASLAARNTAPEKALIALPLIVEPERGLREAPVAWLVQGAVLVTPLALIGYAAWELGTGWMPVLLVAAATALLIFAVAGLGYSARWAHADAAP